LESSGSDQLVLQCLTVEFLVTTFNFLQVEIGANMLHPISLPIAKHLQAFKQPPQFQILHLLLAELDKLLLPSILSLLLNEGLQDHK
jgi:hypothetical protein